MNEEPTSPRIAELQVRVGLGDLAAVHAFWRRAAEEGTPIVEPIPGDETHRLVTFVFRAPGTLTNVAIYPGIERAHVMAQNQMTLLPATDVWYRTYRARADLRATYYISPNDPLRSPDEEIDRVEEAAHIAERAKVWLTDPLNPNQFTFEPGWPAHSLIELPHAPAQPYLAKREGVPEGAIERDDLVRDPFGEGRRIWTYLPPGYDPGAGPYPLILVFDGWGGRRLGVHTTLDNMTADGIIPPTVCVMLHQLDRNIELTCNGQFADWLAQDFVPSWVRERYAVTDDPVRTVVSGMSLGRTWRCLVRVPASRGIRQRAFAVRLILVASRRRSVRMARAAIRSVAVLACALAYECGSARGSASTRRMPDDDRCESPNAGRSSREEIRPSVRRIQRRPRQRQRRGTFADGVAFLLGTRS